MHEASRWSAVVEWRLAGSVAGQSSGGGCAIYAIYPLSITAYPAHIVPGGLEPVVI